ncbi:MAG: WYL domain-containing protein [Lachnospiraceae bacterium]|nr:WYL domain-containing protein [Lachnospiraceae bacterium]
MYTTGNKKMLNMLILDILKEYSDEEHKLTQQEIIKLLRKNYDMDCDRRSVKNNILSLIEMGYEINMENGYYLEERELENAELRILIDSVLFSKTLSATQAKRMIKKLETFGNRYFTAKVSHVSNTPSRSRTENKQVLYTVNAINDAIDEKKKIRFRYCKYGPDLKLHDRGKDYVVNPYQMIASNGHYYLLGNVDRYNNVSYFRIDKMVGTEILDMPVKPMKDVQELKNGLDLPKHMAEHAYMFCGESVPVQIRCKEDTVDDLVDWFGRDIKVLSKNSDTGDIVVRVICNYNAMFYWALQYGPHIEVLEPKNLRKELMEAIQRMAEKYKD